MKTTIVHRSGARSCGPDRLTACSVRCAATAIPVLPFLGSRSKTPARQPSSKPDFSRDEQNADRAVSALQQSSARVSTGPPQHHHVSHIRPFVLGSPPGLLGGSHTQPANSGIAAHGCYRLLGPARICKRGDCLIARLLPGARLELLGSGGGYAAAVQAPSPAPSHAPSHSRDQTSRGTTTTTATTTTGTGSSMSLSLDAEAAGTHPWPADSDVTCACASLSSGSYNEEGDEGDDEDDGCVVTECVLVASYVELGGSASSMDTADAALQPAVHHHNGHTYLSVRNMPTSAVIELGADGDLSHPVNVTPSPPPPQ